MLSGRDQTAAQSGRACLTAAPPPLHNPCCRAVPSCAVRGGMADQGGQPRGAAGRGGPGADPRGGRRAPPGAVGVRHGRGWRHGERMGLVQLSCRLGGSTGTRLVQCAAGGAIFAGQKAPFPAALPVQVWAAFPAHIKQQGLTYEGLQQLYAQASWGCAAGAGDDEAAAPTLVSRLPQQLQ